MGLKGAARKRSWRKRKHVSDIDDDLPEVLASQSRRRRIEAAPDDQLFQLDTKADESLESSTPVPIQLTKRQKGALSRMAARVHREVEIEKFEEDEDRKPSKSSLARRRKQAVMEERINSKAKRALANQALDRKPQLNKEEQPAYDIWEADIEPKVNLSIPAAADHYLRTKRAIAPKRNAVQTARPSGRRAVEVAPEAASYNPEATAYREYIAEAAEEFLRVEEREQKTEKRTKPADNKFATAQEQQLELMQGLGDEDGDDDDEDEDEVVEADDAMDTSDAPPSIKKNYPLDEGERISNKERRRRLIDQQKAEAKEQRKKEREEERKIFSSKKLVRQLENEELKSRARRAGNKAAAVHYKLYGAHRLGRRAQTKPEKAALVPSMLPKTLRSLAPQTDVIAESMRSLERRNILDMGGDRKNKPKPKRLRYKMVPKRAIENRAVGGLSDRVKDVVQTSEQHQDHVVTKNKKVSSANRKNQQQR